MIGFNLFYCWFASKYAFNRNIKYTQSFISDYEKKIKELEQKTKKEKDEKIKIFISNKLSKCVWLLKNKN